MDRLKHILLIILACSFQQISFAQKNNPVTELNEIDKKINESLYISTNANSYITGETLYYKVFCLNKSTNVISKYNKVAYISLVDSDKKILFTHKLFLEDGTGNSSFFIPTTLETGNYKIVGYTNWMLNKETAAYFDIDICIVNPYKEKPTNTILQALPTAEAVKNENIALNLSNKTYNTRDLIELKVNTTSNEFTKGDYVLSVKKIDGFLNQPQENFKENQIRNFNNSSDNTIKNSAFVLPELRGEIISGRISSTNSDIKNKKIALSIIGKNYNLKLAKTDSEGRFIFNLEKANPSSNIIVQIIEENKQDYAIEIDKPKAIDLSNLKFPNLQFNSEFKERISERLISSQIENAYYNIKKDSILTSNDSIHFYNSLSKEFRLDDYTRFPTIEETVTEIVTGVYFTKTKNNYTLHFYHYDVNNDFEMPVLVMVDGLIVEDTNELFTYSPKNIYKINVIRGLYYYGSKSFNGLVAFTTKNGDYQTKLKGSYIIRPELLRPQSDKEYFQPDYATNKNTRIPDYRHQLLWMPKVNLSDPNSKITFYASDITGKFEVILEGFSEKGKPVFIKEIIEIKETSIN